MECKQQIDTHIRWMVRRDMGQVHSIENESFEYPWTEDDFIQELKKRNQIGMVCELPDHTVLGYMAYALHKKSIHLLSLAVAPQYRRSTVGTQLIDKLKSKLSAQRRSRIIAEIRETNLPAQLFFRELGFVATDILRGFYECSREDAYLMQYAHQQHHNRIKAFL